MTTVFYTQHELTDQEIRADETRNAAIARNRAKRGYQQREMTEMVHTADVASPAQKALVERLLEELRTVSPAVFAQASPWWATVCDTITKGDVSPVINRLKLRISEAGAVAPVVNPSPVPVTYAARTPRDAFTDVPDGYYAVETDDNVLAFYRVSTWKRSGDRKVQVHASDELHLVKGHKATDAILAKIRAAKPDVAGKRFADEIGSCYRCGRTLTDETSRALGIGPKCRNMF